MQDPFSLDYLVRMLTCNLAKYYYYTAAAAAVKEGEGRGLVATV